MAKMYIGKKNAIPVRGTPSLRGDDIVNILDNEDLQGALDLKLDKSSVPNSLYATDNNGVQIMLDASTLLGKETAPEGYTEVEYISSSDTINEAEFGNEDFAAAAVTYTWTQSDKYSRITGKFQQAESIVGFPVSQFRFVALDSDNFTVYAENTDPDNPQSAVFVDSGAYSSFSSVFGFNINIVNHTSFREGDTFTVFRIHTEGGQYINTGINVWNYPTGKGVYDQARSIKETYISASIADGTDLANFTNMISLMSTAYGTAITGVKLTYLNGTYSIYPDPEEYETDEPYRTFAGRDALQNQAGINIASSTTPTSSDILYFYRIPNQSVSCEIETEWKASDYFNNKVAASGVYGSCEVLGSVAPNGQYGVKLEVAFGDGIGYKHYYGHSKKCDMPYQNGIWNSVTLTNGNLLVNGQSEALNIDFSDVRTTPGFPILLFACSVDYATTYYSGCSLKRTAIKLDGRLAFYGIPCIDNATGRAGMYDTVSNQFFGSETALDFVAGPVVTSQKVTLGLDEKNTLVGINSQGVISSYRGANGIKLDTCYEDDTYEELEYIESTDGNISFDTGIWYGQEAQSWRGYEVEFYQTEATSTSTSGYYYGYIFGDGQFANPGENYLRTNFCAFQKQYRFDYSKQTGGYTMIYPGSESINTWHTFGFTKNRYYMDGVAITMPNAVSTSKRTNSIHLFACPPSIGGSYSRGLTGRIRRFREYYATAEQINSDTVVLKEFIPVRRKTDGAIGFLDRMNGTFCQNVLDTGIPTAGPKKGNTVELEVDVNSLIKNIAADKDTSLMITTPTLPESSTAKNLSGSSDLIIGPYGEITSNSVVDSIAINGQSQGSRSIVIGKGSIAASSSSIVIGDRVKTTGPWSIVIGSGDTSTSGRNVGERTVVVGHDAQSGDNATGAVLVGHHVTTSNGTNQVAVGYLSSVSGHYGVAIGYYAQAFNGGYNIAIGANARADGTGGIAIGNTSDNADVNRTIAKEYSVAIGAKAQALGFHSIAIGQISQLSSVYSVALGYGAHDTGNSLNYSVGIGYNATISSSWSVALGNESKTEGACSIAIGSEAHVLNSGATTGDQCLNSIAIGAESTVDKSNAIALGYQASASGYNIAIGQNAISNNDYSVAIGHQAQGNSQSSIAIGSNTISAGEQGICVGTSSSVSGTWSIGIGSFVNASHTKSIAIGTNASSQAQEAIQLGSGTNKTTGSLQFRNYPLVDSDGTIPYERLSTDTPVSGYVLAYDGNSDTLTWVENGEGGGSYILPIASASTLGGIKVGDGLQINSETGVLSVTGGGSGGGEGVWGQITGNLEDQTDLKAELDARVQQLEEMPIASSDYNERVIQFTGITDLLFDHGFFYECQYRKVSNIDGSTSDSDRFAVTFDVPRFEKYLKVYEDYEVQDGDSFVFRMAGDGDWYISVNGDELTDISPNNLPYMGVNVILYGSAEIESGDEIYADYLAATNPDSQSGYIWTQIAAQPQHDVIDNVTSTSTTDALSANQGRILSDRIDNISAVGQFLAIWDANRQGNNARYLSDGYVYENPGCYFIVGAVDSLTEPKGEYHASIANPSLSVMYSITQTEPVEYYHATIDETHTATWNATKQKWVDELGNEFINNITGDNNSRDCLGFVIVSGSTVASPSQLTDGDTVIIDIIFPHNYMPTGDHYDASAAGCERTMDDVQVSDMYFYDGTQWILLANHTQSIAIDHEINGSSKNPVENRAIYQVLEGKVSTTRQTNRLYGTDAYRSQTAYELGDGLAFEEGKLVNTVDISGKQDTLVSGVNIKTINDQSILGSGNIVIQGGGGSSDAVGTCNISNVFTGWYIKEDGEEGDGTSNWKGNSYDLMFTLNAPLDYIKENKNDLYVTFSRRNTQSAASNRAWRMLDDQRKKTNLKMYCWRYNTGKYFNNEFETWVNDYDGNYYNDLRYIYFYTLSDYSNDVDELLTDNPTIWYSDLRHQGDTSIEDENFSQGNWGTCFNELAEYGPMSDKWDDRWGDYDNFERCARYDISEVQVDDYVEYNPKEDTIWLDKMRGKLYKTANGDKVYLWSNCWWDDGAVYAILDGNDDPIYNKVPSDMSELSYFCEVSELESKDLVWAEDRNDLDYRRFNLSETYKAEFVNHCRECSTNCGDGSPDTTPRCYLRDYPIRPVRLSECRIFMKYGAPHHYDPEEGVYTNDYYNREYYEHAYTLDQIEASEELQYMLAAQKEIIFVYPYDTHHLWMRNLGWQRMVYEHANIHSEYDYDEEEWRNDVFSWDYKWDGEEPGEGTPYHTTDPETGNYARTRNTNENPFYVKPWDRHNLIRAMFLCGKRNKEINCGYDDWTMGQFDNNMGFFNGTHKNPRWKMKHCTVYYYPVQFNINTGKQLSKGPTSNSTPFNVTLQLSDAGNQNIKVM